MNIKELRALTLVGPPRDNPELDPLAELHPNNQYLSCELRKNMSLNKTQQTTKTQYSPDLKNAMILFCLTKTCF